MGRKGLKLLWVVNGTAFILMLACGVLIDGNECIAGLEEAASAAVLFTILGVGITASGVALVVDRRRWLVCVALLLFYLVMILPAI